jgi:hypothetical protein
MSRLAVGDGMKVFKNKRYSHLVTIVGLLLLTSCNPQEFYEKSFLVNQEGEESELGDPIGTLFDPESDVISFPGVSDNDDRDNISNPINDDTVADNNDQGDDQGSSNDGDDTVADNNDQGDDQGSTNDGDDTVADNSDQGDDQGSTNDGDDTVVDNSDQGDDQGSSNDGDNTVADNNDQGDDQGSTNDGDDTVADNNDQGDDQGSTNDGDDTVAENNDQGDDQGSTNDGDDTVAENIPGAPVCDPFGGQGEDQRNGIRGSLYDGLGQQLRVVNDYYTKGQLASSDLYFSSLNVPTRKFTHGFTTPSGETLKSVNGQTLHEWFAINFQGRIRLNNQQEAGLYEFALLNDDGAVLSVGNSRDNLSMLISADYHTATRFSCSNRLVYMNHLQDLSFNLDYFQGPREHIALILMWRKIESEDQYQQDPQCGKSGPNMYFNSNTNPSTPNATYNQLLARGFKVVDASNFLLPNENDLNPCVAAKEEEKQESAIETEIAKENKANTTSPTVTVSETEKDKNPVENIIVANDEKEEEQALNTPEEQASEVVVSESETVVISDIPSREIAQSAEALEEEVKAEVSLVNQVEKFLQNNATKKKVDILWVIDDSGSMRNDQKRLADNFETFIYEFLDRKLDFNMAITTTDPTPKGDGKRVGGFNQLSSAKAEKNERKFLNDFKRTVNVGTRGSPKEMGISASLRFLQRYADHNSEPFVRDDAYLIIIYLSDEEDQSPLAVSHYANAIMKYKPNPSDIKVYSIVTDKRIMNQWETVGHRYMAMANIFGGIQADIKDDFYPILRDMGLSIANLVDSFALAGVPHNEEVEIYVDGVRLNNGFSFDNQTRTIRFDQSSTPQEGASVEIHYKTLSVETN